MKYINSSLRRYLGDLRKTIPAPGGGSAGALCAALGGGLLLMASGYTLKSGRLEGKKAAVFRKKVREIGKCTDALGRIIDLDVKVYSAVQRAMAIPRHKKRRKKILLRALINSMDVQLGACRLIGKLFSDFEQIYQHITGPILSDAGCAVELLNSAMGVCKINVLINLKYIKDEGIRLKTKTILNGLQSSSFRIYKKITLFTRESMGD